LEEEMKKCRKFQLITLSVVSAFLFAGLSQTAVASDGGDLKPLPIGAVLAMTGSGAFYGKVMSRGMKLAINQINASGGVAGYRLTLKIKDHESGNTRAATSGTRALMSVDKVPVIVSSYGGVTMAIQPITARRKVLVLNGGGTASTLIGKKDLYNTRMVASQLTPSAVKWATQHFGAKRVAVIYYSTDSGRETNKAVEKACKKFGCKVVDQEPYKIGSTNFKAPLARIKSKHPDVLFIGSWGNDVGYIVKQARENNLGAKLVGLELLPSETKIAGNKMNGYWAVFDRFSPEADNPATRQFVKAYKKKYGKVPGYYAANYYEAVKDIIAPVIHKAVEAGHDPLKPGILASTMKELISHGHKFQTVYGGKLKLKKSGAVVKPVGVFEVKDMKPVLVRKVVDGKFIKPSKTAK
jgi:branched-chain amino acid transport system substrate-binding protein